MEILVKKDNLPFYFPLEIVLGGLESYLVNNGII